MTNTIILGSSLATWREHRNAMLERMVAILLEHREGLETDRDAIRILSWSGFGFRDTALLAHEARYLAKQELIAREMSEP